MTAVVVGQQPNIVVSVGGNPPVGVTVGRPSSVNVNTGGGSPGPPGQSGAWVSMTKAEYDALPSKDPQTLYVIVG